MRLPHPLPPSGHVWRPAMGSAGQRVFRTLRPSALRPRPSPLLAAADSVGSTRQARKASPKPPVRRGSSGGGGGSSSGSSGALRLPQLPSGRTATLEGGSGGGQLLGSFPDGGSLAERLAAAGSAASNIVPAPPLDAGGLGRHRALVLDSACRPINCVNWFKAVMMDELGKVDVLDYYEGAVALSAYRSHPLPAVVRVRLFVNIHEVAGKVSLTRRNVMVRDRFQCQYCASKQHLTIDHVTPVSKNGGNTWQNLVTACASCNQKKKNHTLRQMGWRLRIEPKEPSPLELGLILGVSYGDMHNPPSEWAPYLQPYKDKLEAVRARAMASAAADALLAGDADVPLR